jgi:hypothetical protein
MVTDESSQSRAAFFSYWRRDPLGLRSPSVPFWAKGQINLFFGSTVYPWGTSYPIVFCSWAVRNPDRYRVDSYRPFPELAAGPLNPSNDSAKTRDSPSEASLD